MKSLLLCLLLPTLATQNRDYTIGEVLRYARQLTNDSVTVRLTGYVTRKLGGNTYLFEDRTAEIKIDIDTRYLPTKPFTDKDPVVIRALVQYEMNKPVTLKANRPISLEE
ncbi:MAG TPA: NirD/YgiW/YdeI family stress tolerance protein [Chitinophaga sp.]|uniref:NirD/YgiW/YdeI family stress tolerance protein n=1 Tax=Chitinophaga sp. TaxID=1869181 RepID=UPI002B899860|nr:NirD/YgiW/YdeI family stress tolerance protein [Chitinophaga sp.]HVI44160.1 NirD/YgiW/YdeI family stress tolerance protein [Chitinophaga sp.]